MRYRFLDDEVVQLADTGITLFGVRLVDGGGDFLVEILVGVARRVPGLAGHEALAQYLDGVAGAVVHQVAAGLVVAAHVGTEGAVFQRFHVHVDAHLLVVRLQHGDHVHVIGAAGADLDVEAEALRVTGVGQQFFGFLRIVAEQFLGGGGEVLQRGVELGPALRERVVEQLAFAVEQRGENGPLVDGQVHGAAHAHVIEGLFVGLQGDVGALGGHVLAEFQLRGGFLQLVDQLPADRFHDVHAAGAERRHRTRFVLDDVIDHFFIEWQLVFLAVDGGGVPVVVVLFINLLTAGLDVGDAVGAGAGGVFPVGALVFAQVLPFRRQDAVVVAPGQAVRPVTVEFAEVRHHGVLVRGFPAFHEVPESGNGAWVVPAAFERGDHVVGHQLAALHDAGHFLPVDALAQMEHHAHGVFFHFPAFRQAAFQLAVGNIGLLDEAVFVAAARAVLKIAAQQRLHLQVVVVAFPGPSLQVPGGGVQGAVDRGNIDGAVGLRGFRRGRPGPGQGGGGRQGQGDSRCTQIHDALLVLLFC